MSFGRFKGGQHFSKKALQELVNPNVNKPLITTKQIDFIKDLGVTDFRLDNLTKEQATFLIKELLRDKEATLKRINARCG